MIKILFILYFLLLKTKLNEIVHKFKVVLVQFHYFFIFINVVINKYYKSLQKFH